MCVCVCVYMNSVFSTSYDIQVDMIALVEQYLTATGKMLLHLELSPAGGQ
jgi:hypothetical protein